MRLRCGRNCAGLVAATPSGVVAAALPAGLQHRLLATQQPAADDFASLLSGLNHAIALFPLWEIAAYRPILGQASDAFKADWTRKAAGTIEERHEARQLVLKAPASRRRA